MPGIWAPKCARIPAQKNRRSGPHPSQKTGRLLPHVCPGGFTSNTALLMLGPPPCCRHFGGRFKPSSQLSTASLNAIEALVYPSGKAAAPALLVTELYRQKRCPYSGHEIKTWLLNPCLHFWTLQPTLLQHSLRSRREQDSSYRKNCKLQHKAHFVALCPLPHDNHMTIT